MTLIVWLAVGAAIGLAAILVHRIAGSGGRLANLAAGMLGALGGGYADGRGRIASEPFEPTTLIVAAAGAVILVGIVNLFRRGGTAA